MIKLAWSLGIMLTLVGLPNFLDAKSFPYSFKERA